MNKDEAMKEFEKNIEFLRKNVPPDDIYMFTEQIMNTCYLCVKELNRITNLDDLAEKNQLLGAVLGNFLKILRLRQEGLDFQLQVNEDLF